MICPRVPVAQIVPAERLGSYCLESIMGSEIKPIAITVAPTIPVLAAIRAPTNITAIARLPLKPPITSDILLSKSWARFDFSRSTPMKTNNGTATNVMLVMSPYSLFGIAPRKALSNVPVKIPTPAKINAVPASENATGNPASKTRHITPNISRGMNSTIFNL